MSFLSHASEATKKSPPSLLQLSKKTFLFPRACVRASAVRSLFLLLYAVCSSSKVEPTAAAAVGGGVLFYSLPLRTYAFSLL